jgi:hypothetical protein
MLLDINSTALAGGHPNWWLKYCVVHQRWEVNTSSPLQEAIGWIFLTSWRQAWRILSQARDPLCP